MTSGCGEYNNVLRDLPKSYAQVELTKWLNLMYILQIK